MLNSRIWWGVLFLQLFVVFVMYRYDVRPLRLLRLILLNAEFRWREPGSFFLPHTMIHSMRNFIYIPLDLIPFIVICFRCQEHPGSHSLIHSTKMVGRLLLGNYGTT
jgi:hypothetical protein